MNGLRWQISMVGALVLTHLIQDRYEYAEWWHSLIVGSLLYGATLAFFYWFGRPTVEDRHAARRSEADRLYERMRMRDERR